MLIALMASKQRMGQRFRACIKGVQMSLQRYASRWDIVPDRMKPEPERSFFDQVKAEVLADKRLPTGSHQMLAVMKVLGRKEEVTSGKRTLSEVVKEETDVVLNQGW